MRAPRRARGAGRRVLHAAGRAPAGRGPHPRRRARARAVRRAVAHGPRLRARGGRPGADRAAATRSPREPRGDLLQAGPLLVAGGEVAYDPDADAEGFRAAAHQFDPDPTDGRHPRAALGLADGRLVAVACDGRSRHDAGLTLVELARLMLALGCERRAQSRRRRLDRADLRRAAPEPPARRLRGAGAGRAPDRDRAGVPTACYARPGMFIVPGHRTFTRAAGRHGARVLPARRVRARRAQPRERARPRRLGRDDPVGLADAARRPGRRARVLRRARRPPAGLHARARGARTRCAPTRRCTRRTRTAPGAPDRVFASLDDDEYERQVTAWCRALQSVDAANADVLHLHHLTPINEAARARRARRADRRPPARHRAADARGDRGRPGALGRTARRGPRACARGRARASG